MSVEEQIRAEMRDVGLSVEPDTALALAQVETGVHRQRTRRNLVLATAAAVATVAGVVWAGGSLGWPIGQGDVQPVEQPVQEPIDLDGDWVLVEDADLHDVHGLSQIISVGGRLVAVGDYGTPIVTSTDGIEWTPADTPGDVEEARVIRGGPGLIVFGHSTTEDRPAVWTSPDGETWTPVEDPDGELGGPNTSISSIVAGGPGFVAAGSFHDKPAAWTSPDGLEWALAQELSSTSGWVNTVVQHGSGFIAEGNLKSDGPTDPDDVEPGIVPTAWTSVDGTSWAPVADDTLGLLSDEFALGTLLSGGHTLQLTGDDSTRNGGASYVTINHDEDRCLNTDAGCGPDGGNVWTVLQTSVDGQAWTRVPEQQHGLDGLVNEVIDTDAGFVAVGRLTSDADWSDAAIWTSVDGITWESVTDESFGGERGQVMNDVVATDNGLVAVGITGWDQTAVANWSAAVWVLEQP